jgi:hypothetical protein
MMLMDMDQELFKKYQHEIKAIHMQEKHEMTGQCLEIVAASKSFVLRVCQLCTVKGASANCLHQS